MSNLTVLSTWHQLAKVASVEKRKVLPPFKNWTNADDLKLEEAKLDTVKMAHTRLGHMGELNKKELVLTVHVMIQKDLTNWWLIGTSPLSIC